MIAKGGGGIAAFISIQKIPLFNIRPSTGIKIDGYKLIDL
jgi:hypothetical protein